MIRLIVPIFSLLTGVALLLLGSGLLNTVLALRGNLEGYSAGNLGLIMSGYFVGFFVGTFIALPLVHRIGHIRTFAFCAAMVSATVLLHSLLVNPWAWFLIRVATGTMVVILYTVIEGWLNGQTPPEQRGRVFAIYMATNLGALALAQQLVRIASPAEFTLFAISALLLSCSLAPVTLSRLAQPVVNDVSRMPLVVLYRTVPVAVAASLLSGLAMGAFWGLGAVYAGRIGLASNDVATFMTCAILGGVIGQFPLGRYSDTHDRRWVLVAISLVAVAAALLLAALSAAGLWVLLAITLYGAMAFATYPVAVAHMIDHLPREKMLAGGSALLLIHGVGAALGPALAGQCMEWLGLHALPAYFVVMQATLAAFTVISLGSTQKLRDGLTELKHNVGHFVPMLRTTPTVLEMVPDEPAAQAAAPVEDEPPAGSRQ